MLFVIYDVFYHISNKNQLIKLLINYITTFSALDVKNSLVIVNIIEIKFANFNIHIVKERQNLRTI